MPALCNPDFEGMEFLHAKLVRKTTCSNGCRCDYTICGDQDAYLKDHPEYRDDLARRFDTILAAFGEPAQPGYRTGASATGRRVQVVATGGASCAPSLPIRSPATSRASWSR